MMRLAMLLSLLSACVPTPSRYSPFTCERYGAEWSNRVMPDPNDPTRLAWPICDRHGTMFAIPPANPRGD